MAEFTTDELLEIAGWAMDAADRARAGKLVNAYKYETAKGIFDKVHEEYHKRTKEG